MFVAVAIWCFVGILCLLIQFGVLLGFCVCCCGNFVVLLGFCVCQCSNLMFFWYFVFVAVAILCFVGRASIALTHILLLTSSPTAPILIHKLETKFSTHVMTHKRAIKIPLQPYRLTHPLCIYSKIHFAKKSTQVSFSKKVSVNFLNRSFRDCELMRGLVDHRPKTIADSDLISMSLDV